MILVTGGTGLVGAHLLFHLLSENKRVKAIYRSEESLLETISIFKHYSDEANSLYQRITWIKADITDVPSLEIAFKGITQVYHAAAMISFNPAAWSALKKTNFEGTANIVNLCLAHKVEKLCYVSSIAAVGRGTHQAVVTEENDWLESETSVYALSKHLAEMEVWRGSQEGLKVVIVNPGVILGPGNWNQGSLKFFAKTAKGIQRYFPGGTGFVAVKDVASAMYMLMESEVYNERFITISENMSFKNLLVQISNSFGLDAPSKQIPMWQMEIGWRLDWFSHYFLRTKRRLTRDTVNSLKTQRMYSSEKIEKTIGFEFSDLQKCIASSCAYFKSRYPEAFK
ncbi:NAD-dependent epimerase/dehydratase family protein [Muriicola soli]|uniref:NAD-dependent epimerase/dehydratase family protein n=1 Tax=Muriicola soli TaxID=2507538 RepID=A0A411EBQ2_9FLAO|nr:NAD-dependent epimerase/dehydratase family protein [Muriicola soli]QBA65099.1 NAD-dependent epimerase/dehydratase family protein [Muriicola soli]